MPPARSNRRCLIRSSSLKTVYQLWSPFDQKTIERAFDLRERFQTDFPENGDAPVMRVLGDQVGVQRSGCRQFRRSTNPMKCNGQIFRPEVTAAFPRNRHHRVPVIGGTDFPATSGCQGQNTDHIFRHATSYTRTRPGVASDCSEYRTDERRKFVESEGSRFVGLAVSILYKGEMRN